MRRSKDRFKVVRLKHHMRAAGKMPGGRSKDRELFRATPSQAKTGPNNQSRSYAARDRCLACQGAVKTQKFVPARSSFGGSRLCLFSQLELLFSPSQCLRCL